MGARACMCCVARGTRGHYKTKYKERCYAWYKLYL